MNVLSLFSGIGGLELGLERAGMTVVGQVEIDPFCRSVLTAHWPEVPRHDDVRTAVDWWRGQRRPAVHVVAGGFPCQPVSSAGKRLGEADERWLWPAYLAVVRELRPRYAVMENVAALLERGAGTVLGDLAACGYDAEWDCIPAAAVGAPHRRDRWFAVAYPSSPERGATQPAGVAPAGWPTPELGERRGGSRPGRHWWAAEPGLGRVVDGLPGRLDEPRLRALGNAVVPQVAEHIGRLIVAADRSEVAA